MVKLRKDTHMSNTMIESNLQIKFPNCIIHISDPRKFLVYKEDIDKAIAHINIMRGWLGWFKPRWYTRHKYDCEDFAREWDGLAARFFPEFAFGRVNVNVDEGSSLHALNCCIDQFGRFHYIEPQSNMWFSEADNYSPYLIII